MDLRLRTAFSGDDDRVPLPHGTEVVTRVDHVLGERRIPRGTVGRVMKIDGDAIEVAVVGVGTLRLARSELTPRRAGQLAFARRRQIAWATLRENLVLETVVGSRAWGLADSGSDEDRRGVFALPFTWRGGIVPPPEDLVSADGSSAYWSVEKCIGQALRADPNTLEALFVPGARALDPIGAWLLEEREAFVSLEIYGTFGRYALAQLHRLEQGARLHHHRALALSWARADPSLTLDAAADRLADLEIKAFPRRADAVQQAKQWLKQLYRSLADQGLLPASDWLSFVAFAKGASADSAADNFDLPRELRPKNAYNLLRLVWTATRWLSDGAPTFAAAGATRERLLAIKRGEVGLAEVLAEAEAMLPALEAARAASALPARPDIRRADRLQRRIAEEVARRHVQREPGPWGAGAPPRDEPEWDDD